MPTDVINMIATLKNMNAAVSALGNSLINLYANDTETSLPNSIDEASTIMPIPPPASSLPIPNTEKYPAVDASMIAVRTVTCLSVIFIIWGVR